MKINVDISFDITSCAFYTFSHIQQDIFYSHYSFQKPHLQKEPHQSFEKEVKYTVQGVYT